jgi:3-methyladenine DNA glycosylase/8-oxoguanine DNA glycosylase
MAIHMATPVQLYPAATEFIDVDPPFHPRTTLIKPSHFPSPFDMQSSTEYRAVTMINDQPTGVCASFDEDHPSVRLDVSLPADASYDPGVMAVLQRRLGLDLDLRGFQELCLCDEVLARLPPAMHGARPSSPWSLYEYLTIGTVLQNTSVARTVQMAKALADLLGTPYSFPDGLVLTSFWHPHGAVDIGEQTLRDAKLGYRAKTLVRVGEQFTAEPALEDRLHEQAHDVDALRVGLRKIYGVGPATTGYLMFDVFKTLDELTHLPPWEGKIMGKLLFDNQDADPSDTVRWCHDRWAPYTMLACHTVFETVFWHRATGEGPTWLDKLIRM